MLTDTRLAPTSLVAVSQEHDFRSPRSIGNVQMDCAFNDLAFDRGGRTAVALTGSSGVGVQIEFDRTAPWVQVCTSDWPGRPGHREGVAVEPMTCPPNALASSADLVVLAPRDEHEMTVRIAAVEPTRPG